MNYDLSIIIPVYNEGDNLPILYEQLHSVLAGQNLTYEIILVDDGSTDKTRKVLRELSDRDPSIKAIIFRRNYGQTAAMSAGFHVASGDVIIPMDADLQNDPADIPKLLAKIEEGYDVVSGWRKDRKDALLTRRWPSMIANKLISWIGTVPLKDYGCTLKAYRSSFIKQMRLFGEMHRFIPIYADWMGAKIAEIPVNHRPRIYGKSKYGLFRTFKVLLDLTTVKFLGEFSTKPIYVFGGLGFLCMGVGAIIAVVTLIQKMAYGVWVHRNPLLVISIFFLLAGFQCLLMGLLAEIVIRIYHESYDRPTYWIQETLNLNDQPCAG